MTKILVLGDSHIRCLRLAKNGITYKLLDIGGATAQGAVNPNSSTHALTKWTKLLKGIPAHDFSYVATMLGEVDCGFVIWFRAEKHQISIEEQLEISIHNYEKFIKEVVNQYFPPEKTLVLSSPLPTIEDNTTMDILKGARSSVKSSKKERTDLTLEYNRRLEEMCKRNNFIWVEASLKTLNESTGLLDDKWKNTDPSDHHLDSRKACKLYDDEIQRMIKIKNA